jgi:hypothetical protein
MFWTAAVAVIDIFLKTPALKGGKAVVTESKLHMPVISQL